MRPTFLPMLCLVQPALALAQPDLSPLQRPSRPMIAAAQQHYLSGSRFFEEGQYDAALVEFTASFQLSGERDLLHNISWTHEKAGRARDALAYAERYRAACQGSEEEARAARRVEFLKTKYGLTEGGAVSTNPAASTPVVPTAQNATSAVTAAPIPEGRRKPSSLSIGLLAGGGALTLGGIGCLAGAWTTGQQTTNPDLTFADANGLVDRGKALNATGIALTVAGGALVVGGIVLATLPRRAVQPSAVSRTLRTSQSSGILTAEIWTR